MASVLKTFDLESQVNKLFNYVTFSLAREPWEVRRHESLP